MDTNNDVIPRREALEITMDTRTLNLDWNNSSEDIRYAREQAVATVIASVRDNVAPGAAMIADVMQKLHEALLTEESRHETTRVFARETADDRKKMMHRAENAERELNVRTASNGAMKSEMARMEGAAAAALKSKDADIERLQEDIAEERKVRDQLDAENKRLETEIQQSQEVRENLISEIQRTHNELAETRTALSACGRSEAVQATIENLEAQVAKWESAASTNAAKHLHSENKLEAARRLISDLEHAKQDAFAGLKNWREKNDAQRAELGRLTSELQRAHQEQGSHAAKDALIRELGASLSLTVTALLAAQQRAQNA